MKIALVPLNPLVGDVLHNGEKIVQFVQEAVKRGSQLIVFPEFALIGYPPRDLIRSEILFERQNQVLTKLKRLSKKITIVAGGFSKHAKKLPAFQNVAYVLKNGQKSVYAKRLLPDYDVFDDHRHFVPGNKPLTLKMGKIKFAITICEDIWFDEPRVKAFYKPTIKNELMRIKPDFVINLSASPYEMNKKERRLSLLSRFCQQFKTKVIFVNQFGGNDDLIFDGQVCVMSARGELEFHPAEFQETLHIFDTESPAKLSRPVSLPHEKNTRPDAAFSVLDGLESALITGIRDYVKKSGFERVILGLSGGIDSALVAQLAVKALGDKNVLGVLMPSRHSSRGSVTDAMTLAKNLKLETQTIEIETLHRVYENIFKTAFGRSTTKDLTSQNIQARIRGNLLMAISNNTGRLLLNTTNKSEMAMGYGTLYGDMCGALAVISDLTKTLVYQLARHMNPNFECITREIMNKEPSAELKPDQKDADTLPEYDALDPLVEKWVTAENITEKDFLSHPSFLEMYRQSEYKRKQAPVGLKVSAKAFGSGRRYPIVMKL